MSILKTSDPELYDAIIDELGRQTDKLELIASENFTSPAVLEAVGSVLTNKYAEGYPGKRYYGGCEHVDVVEDIARNRARELFGVPHANVQPHSGTQANMAVYVAMLQPGDTILGMDLSHGGHLSHGSPVNFSGMYFNVIHYGVSRDTETIDYDAVEALAAEHKPKMIVTGASAYSRVIDFARFREIADRTGALVLADIAHIAGLVAAGLHPSPWPHAHFITTTTHKTLRGPRGGLVLCGEEHSKIIDKTVFPGIQGGPLMHTIAAKATSFLEALQDDFKDYQKKVLVNASTLAEALKAQEYRIVSGGTDNHLMLADVLESRGISGKKAERLLDTAGITVNKNTIPFDVKSPFITSGIRIGVPAVTTRGMGPEEMKEIAILMDKAMSVDDEAKLPDIKEEVKSLTGRFPFDRVPEGYHIRGPQGA